MDSIYDEFVHLLSAFMLLGVACADGFSLKYKGIENKRSRV